MLRTCRLDLEGDTCIRDNVDNFSCSPAAPRSAARFRASISARRLASAFCASLRAALSAAVSCACSLLSAVSSCVSWWRRISRVSGAGVGIGTGTEGEDEGDVWEGEVESAWDEVLEGRELLRRAASSTSWSGRVGSDRSSLSVWAERSARSWQLEEGKRFRSSSIVRRR